MYKQISFPLSVWFFVGEEINHCHAIPKPTQSIPGHTDSATRLGACLFWHARGGGGENAAGTG
jgi:hypothetical protein